MRSIFFWCLFMILAFSSGNAKAQTGPGGIESPTTNQLWMDASRQSQANGQLVGTFLDFSGNGHNGTTVSSGRAVLQTNQLNGFPVLTFVANDYYQTGAISALNTDNLSWIVVGRANPGHIGHFISSRYSSGAGTASNHLWKTFFTTNSNSVRSFARNSIGGATVLDHGYNGSFNIYTSILDGNSDQLSIYTNENLSGTANGVNCLPSGHIMTRIGSNTTNLVDFLDGSIAEVIVFSTNLNSAERILIHNYLSSKYSIGISNDHYAFEGTGHYRDLIGIGQEPDGASTTARGQGIVTLSNATSLGDGDYILTAHDAGTTAGIQTGVPSFFTSFGGFRMERTWRIDYTGTPGNHDISFDMTGIHFGADPNNYILLVDDDGNFTNGGTQYFGTGFSYNAGTNTATWSGITLPDGAFFTIANIDAIVSVNSGPWTTPSTWSCGCNPPSTRNVAIINNHTVTANTSGCVARGLGIQTGSTLQFNPGTTVSLTGNLAVDGSITTIHSRMVFNGSTAQTLSNTTANTTIATLTINNASGVSVSSGNFSVSTVLTVTNGLFDVSTANNFTLVSNATATARIAPVGAGGSLAGNFTIQRHIDARGAGFSDMSSPVQNSTFQDWDNELLLVYTYNPPSSFPSAWAYDETDFDYVPITSASTPLLPGQGFEVYLDSDGSQTTFNTTTLNTIGTPNFGTVATPVLTAVNDGWNLIGNPYASFITFNTFRTVNANVFNSAWMFYDEQIEDFVLSLGGTIAPHQGFWVEMTTGPQSVNFTEACKATSTSSVFRSPVTSMFSLRLASEGQTRFTSNTNFLFEEGMSRSYEQGADVTFKKVPHPAAPALFSLSPEGKRLRLNKMESENSLSLPLGFAVGISGFYTLSAHDLELVQDAGFSCVVLEDKVTKTFTDLSQGSYRFFADGSSDDRFVLHLSKDNSACTRSLATTASTELEGISISHTENGIFVNYDLEDEMNSVISVTNLLGQDIVTARSISISKGNVRVMLPESFHGMFIVSVRQGDKMVTRKFFAP